MVVSVIGVILIIIGVVCIFMKKSSQKKLMALSLTDTYTAAKLLELQKTIAGEMGAGSFRQLAEVKGVIECPDPLTAELSKEKCLYYKSEVDIEYEENYYQENQQTKSRELKTRRTSENITRVERGVDFYLKDDTGKVRINPAGAELDLTKSVDRFEPATNVNYSNGAISWGGFSFSVGSNYSDYTREGRKILGYKFSEYIFPLKQKIFVIGEATDSMGELQISKPTTDDGVFVISNKSEEQLAKEAKSSAQTLDIASKACFAIGAIMAVAGFFIK
ncbi:MAG: hypothetical protein A2008_03435 [Candidatus Wallbacteria bacterium GWC2_49_35]|uniref:RING-type E3 ubiquitin transferase n=1 Tax=Candidatus Wallbacteria bacterium GWC2_49_35 TaxID=1817813 RepID=A0A1F7WZZ7_9BACT|nr:MAG: hypothetical protein A2008_03435 [Candidatus Wallbacteria bacterium GWC2_49_35]HBC76892.1 hypothetical protein [Candidatus Wallbacteria bacterium]